MANPIKTEESLASKLANKIKSLDGIDELSSLLGQTLPGIAGPIATASVLVIATPFVWLGVLGMREEYVEGCEAFTQTLEQKNDNEEKLRALAHRSALYARLIKTQFNLTDTPEEAAALLDEGLREREEGESLDEFIYYLTEQQRLVNQQILHGLERKYGWTGIVGMTGMFLGMLPATASAGFDIVSKTTTFSVSATVTSTLATVSSSLFLVGQASMIIYAGNKYRQGRLKIKEIRKTIQLLDKDTCLNADIKKHLKLNLENEIHFIKKHSTQYGIATIFGQACMMAGTLLGLTGFGLLITAPLLAVGAPMTIVPAIVRIVAESRERDFLGSDEGLSELGKRKLDNLMPLRLLAQSKEQGDCVSKDYSLYLGQLQKEFTETTKILSLVVLLSMLHKKVKNKVLTAQSADELLLNVQHDVAKRLKNKKHCYKLYNTVLERTLLEKIVAILNNQESRRNLLNVLTNNPKECEVSALNRLIDTLINKVQLEGVENEDRASKLQKTISQLKFQRTTHLRSITKLLHMRQNKGKVSKPKEAERLRSVRQRRVA